MTKSTSFRGLRKVFFWEKKNIFSRITRFIISSALQPPYLSLDCHHQDSSMTKIPSFADKKRSFWAKRNIIFGITQLYPLLCSLHISLGCHQEDCDCQWKQSSLYIYFVLAFLGPLIEPSMPARPLVRNNFPSPSSPPPSPPYGLLSRHPCHPGDPPLPR